MREYTPNGASVSTKRNAAIINISNNSYLNNQNNNAMDLGDRVIVKTSKKTGYLAYLGTTKFAEGTWAGIILEEYGTGKNNGSVKGVRYFKAPKYTGLFVLAKFVEKTINRDYPKYQRPSRPKRKPPTKSNQSVRGQNSSSKRKFNSRSFSYEEEEMTENVPSKANEINELSTGAWKEKLEHATERIKLLQERLVEKDSELLKLTERVSHEEELRRQIGDLYSKISRDSTYHTHEIRELESSLALTKQSLKEAESNEAALIKQIKELNSFLADKEIHVKVLQKQLESQHHGSAAIDSFGEDMDSAHLQLLNEKQQLENATEMRTKLEYFESMAARLKKKEEEMKRKMANQQSEFKILKQSNRALVLELEAKKDLENANKELNSSIVRFESNVSSLETELTNANHRIAMESSLFEKLQSEHESEMKNLTMELNRLKERLQIHDSVIEQQMQNTVAELRVKLDEKEKYVQTLQTLLDESQTDLRSQNQIIDSLQRKLDDLNRLNHNQRMSEQLALSPVSNSASETEIKFKQG